MISKIISIWFEIPLEICCLVNVVLMIRFSLQLQTRITFRNYIKDYLLFSFIVSCNSFLIIQPGEMICFELRYQLRYILQLIDSLVYLKSETLVQKGQN